VVLTLSATELDAASLYVVRRHLGLEHIYGAAPKAVESARNYFVENVEAMAPRIAKSGRYLMGDQFQRRRYPSDDLSGMGGHRANSALRAVARVSASRRKAVRLSRKLSKSNFPSGK